MLLLIIFILFYVTTVYCSEKSIKWHIKLSRDLAIFTFVSAVLSKLFAGGPKHATLEFMQLCDKFACKSRL